MKTRHGYVSNSSSSSFLVCCNDVDCFEFMRVGDGHDNESHMTFTRDVRSSEHQDAASVKEFIRDEYRTVMHEYQYYLQHKDERWYRNMMGDAAEISPCLKLVTLIHKLGCNNPEAGELVTAGASLVEQSKDGKMNERDVSDELYRKAERFAELLFAEAKRKWKVVSTFGYADEDGDFWGYMEHEFMNEVAHCEQEHFGEYSVYTRNEH